MGRVLTNATSLAYAIESALNTPGSEWNLLEPNSIGALGANISTTAPSPISRNRQRRKGFITDLDSSVEFDADLTLSSFRDFIEGFVLARATNHEVTDMLVTEVRGGTDDDYKVAALDTAQAAILQVGTLLSARGFNEAANNGLQVIDSDPASTDTALEVAANLAPVTAAVITASASLRPTVTFAGYRVPAASAPAWAYSSTTKRGTLTLAGLGTKLLASNLTVGQFVHIGSKAGNAFRMTVDDDVSGYARVVSVAAGSIVFDKLSTALKNNGASANTKVLDILFSQFVRNVKVGSSEYYEKSFQFEGEYPGLATNGVDSLYRYSQGNYCNSLSFALPLSDRATAAFAFIGTDTENPTDTRKSGAATPIEQQQVARFNTTSDIARLRLAGTDEAGISTDFKSLTLTLTNNISPEKVLALLGARYINIGNLDVSLEAQMLFTSPDVLQKIRDNETVSLDFAIKSDDGAIVIDLPSCTLGGGGLELPLNESVLVNAAVQAFGDPSGLDISIGASIISAPVV